MIPEETNTRQELEQLSPLMASLQQQPDGLRVPDGYFEQLSEQLIQAAQTHIPFQEPNMPIRHQTPLRRILYRIGAAAAAVLLLLLGAQWLQQPAAPTCQDLACLEPTEIQAYINEHIQQFDSRTLLDADLDLDATYFTESITEAGDLDEALEDAMYDLNSDELETLLQNTY